MKHDPKEIIQGVKKMCKRFNYCLHILYLHIAITDNTAARL